MDIMLFLKKPARIWAGRIGPARKPSNASSKSNILNIKNNLMFKTFLLTNKPNIILTNWSL